MLAKKVDYELSPRYITNSSIQSPEVQVARLEMMLEATRAFNTTLDLNTLLQAIMEVAMQLIDTEAATILLLDKKDGDFYFELIRGNTPGQAEPKIIAFEGSMAGWIVKSSEILVVDNIQQEERQFNEVEAMAPFKIETVLGGGLVFKEKKIGVIEVFNKRGNGGFTGDDIHTLNILAAQAAAAIENVRFFEQRDRLDRVFNELKLPMTSIVGSSQIMLANPNINRKELRSGLENINREVTRLSQMVNDFLDLARIETGRIKMEKQTVDLKALVQEVIDLFYTQALKKKVSLSLHIDRAIPHIPADAGRLKQAIVNLVDNAIKYNRENGEVEIILSCNKVRAQVSVRDTGHGIPPKELGLVFDKFYREDRDNDEVIGAGLGLPIAKKIIEAHHGDIWVQSEVDAGSTFTFSLPLLDNGES